MTLLLTLAFVCAEVAAASPIDTLRCSIYYHQGESEFCGDIRANRDVVNLIRSARGRILSADIVSSTSPEGNTDMNYSLSRMRSETAADIIGRLTGIDSSDIKVSSIGIDWSGLAMHLDSCRTQLYAREASKIIREVPEWIIGSDSTVVGSRKMRLKELGGGKFWQQMMTDIFPELRVSHVSLVFINDLVKPDFTYTPYKICKVADPQILSVRSINRVYRSAGRYKFAIRSNLLTDIAAVPNLGVEIGLRRGWSLAADAYYADWRTSTPVRYWRCQGAELSLRKDLTPTPPRCTNCWLLEFYTQIFRYNILLNTSGYLSGHSRAGFFDQPTLGVGLAGGYKLYLSAHWRLDFILGLGFQTGQYQTYRIVDDHLVWQSTRNHRFFGPTKAAVMLVYQFGKGGGS